MSFSNQVVDAVYTGDGATTSFPIPFYFVPGEAATVVKVYDLNPTTGVRTLITTGFALLPVPTPPALAIPTAVVFTVAPVNGKKIQVVRESPIEQPTTYSNTGPFPAKTHEKSYDRIVTFIQEIAKKALGFIRFNALDSSADGTLPPMAGKAGFGLVVNPTATGIDFSQAAGGAGAFPSATKPYSLIESNAAGDTFLETTTGIVFNGISALTGGLFSSSGILDTLAKIIRITYTLPTASLTGTNSGTLFERGNTQTNPTLSVAVTKQSDPILDVSFYDGSISGPNQIGTTQVSGGAIPAGGTSTQLFTGSFSTNRTFWARVRDNGASNAGTPQNRDVSVSYSFVYPYYRGAGASGLTAAQVATLTKEVINNTATRTLLSFSVTAGQKIYFAYPAAYAALTSILDVNGFETIADWTLTTSNITGLDGNPVSYKIYSQNSVIGVTGTYQFTFKQ